MSLKASLRSVVALSAQASGYLSAVERRQRESLTILCYHRVLPSHLRDRYFDPELVVTPETLDLHCRVLARNFEVRTLQAALADLRDGRIGKKPLAAITFDDGYSDNLSHAAPILDRHGLKATFFVIAGLVGKQDRPWYDRAGDALRRLNRDAVTEIEKAKAMSPSYRRVWLDTLEREAGASTVPADDQIMDASALQRLKSGGHEIGSHTMTHPLLDQLDRDEMQTEVVQSRSELTAEGLGSIDGFCYPNGNFNEDVKAEVAEAGYAYATALAPGINHQATLEPLALRRWFISETRLKGGSDRASAALFRMEINGVAHKLFRRGGAS